MSVIIIKVALIIYGAAMCLALFRLLKGPSLPDRVVAFDTIGVITMSSVAIIGVLYETQVYLEAVLIIGVLAFISTIATSRFIERGVIFERKRHK
ncbi:Na(+)/H(+) antiporter subunit F1 [Macrococcus brunensis]|uniref:Na(+)/H(+) antiporter subunit F1 n=1 Tax=Macrococcus brunensis TaxID=198483 RepID=A0A4R6BD99_9STAP|nr:Na(+)/H(+) antiporter subunit F1 [Macrococcus brunensis]TDL97727.1 Na(+)/H(+) antiporter subunit F1 [Macrococcus brunensis]ULG72879.1 Na(+)/H(+) antiporter subunit F1 [Macrococcus brunensis]